MKKNNKENKSRRQFIKKALTGSIGAGIMGLNLSACNSNRYYIEYKTTRYAPPAVITMQTDLDNWQNATVGVYLDGKWRFHIKNSEGRLFKIRFVLNDKYNQISPPLTISNNTGSIFTIESNAVKFTMLEEILAENNFIQKLFFFNSNKDVKEYDVIVIGSGFGGGILATELSNRDKNVCLLEAGGYIFPTHVGNLPRRHLPGQFDKNIWSLWHHFRNVNFKNENGSNYFGSQTFNLGGRSLFWGALTPRMTNEAEFWPDEIRDYLNKSGGYQKTESLLNVHTKTSKYQQGVESELQKSLSDFHISAVPMGIEYNSPEGENIPAGIFSTADLLMETKMTNEASLKQNLSIFLNHYVQKLQAENGKIVSVSALDTINDKNQIFWAKKYVLAAGTIESAKLALSSELKDPSGGIGKNLTAHPIFYTHFALDSSSPLFKKGSSAKLILEPANKNIFSYPLKIILEVGTDFIQGRFLNPALREEQIELNKEVMLCEVVFMVGSHLQKKNSVAKTEYYYDRPQIRFRESIITESELAILNKVSKKIINSLMGTKYRNESLELKRAPAGGVSHEVGTLRMGTDKEKNYLDGVVTPDLKFHAYDNLYACDLSVFPYSPAANPSLTLSALALRLAEKL